MWRHSFGAVLAPLIVALAVWPGTVLQAVASELDDAVQLAFERALTSAQAAAVDMENEDYRSVRVEYWSKLVLAFTYKKDLSVCQILIWMPDAQDDFPNKVIDFECDGTGDSVKLLGQSDFEPRPLSDFEARFLAFFLNVAADSFDAASRIKDVNPDPTLALIPDFEALTRNRQLMRELADAATDSSLMGNPAESEAMGPDDRIFQIFVNGGPDDGGVLLAFGGKKSGGSLTGCEVGYWEPGESVILLDERCDGIFEGGSKNGVTRKLSVAGMENVVHGMLLDVARFARVANRYFSLK